MKDAIIGGRNVLFIEDGQCVYHIITNIKLQFMKAKIYFLSMVFVALLMVGCSDDDGIRLTQDEVIGDINTGKQVGIKGNSLVIYTTQGDCVNVQGAKGKISAQSSDEKVVTVTCIHETGQYGKDERVSLKAVAVGKAIVTVTDEDGNEAKLAVEVKDVEELWHTVAVAVTGQKRCIVEGVSKEDSLAIASDAIASKPYQVFRLKRRDYEVGMFSAYRLQILDAQKNVLVDGYYRTEDNEDHSIHYYYVKNRDNETLESFYERSKDGQFFFWDLTDKYKKTYPQVTNVELGMDLGTMS